MSNLTPAQRDVRFATVTEMRRRGLSYPVIAERLGVGTRTLENWFRDEKAKRADARAVLAKPRPCLRCRADFPSEGWHHRMCGECRALSISPMAADPGGNAGRHRRALR